MCDTEEELVIGERTWRNSVQPIEKDGYREGHESGKQESFQNGFDVGYKEGFEIGYNLAYKNGEHSVLQKLGLSDNNESAVKIPNLFPWKGNCDICQSEGKTDG